MQRSSQMGPASASGRQAGTDVEVPDDVLDAITGGGSHGEGSGRNDSPRASAGIEPKPVNDLVGRVVRKDFA